MCVCVGVCVWGVCVCVCVVCVCVCVWVWDVCVCVGCVCVCVGCVCVCGMCVCVCVWCVYVCVWGVCVCDSTWLLTTMTAAGVSGLTWSFYYYLAATGRVGILTVRRGLCPARPCCRYTTEVNL